MTRPRLAPSGDADRELALPDGGAREEQVRHVGAGDEQARTPTAPRRSRSAGREPLDQDLVERLDAHEPAGLVGGVARRRAAR